MNHYGHILSTADPYIRRPNLFVGPTTHGPDIGTFGRSPGFGIPTGGAFNAEKEFSDQGGVVWAIGALRNQLSRELAPGHFIFIQRYNNLLHELPSVNEPATVSSLNLLLRRKALSYHSIPMILDQWRPMGFVNNVVQKVVDWGVNHESQQQVNVTVTQCQKNVFNYWLNSQEREKAQHVTNPNVLNSCDEPGMFLGFILKFMKVQGVPEEDMEGVAFDNKPSILGKRTRTGYPSTDAFFESLDMDALHAQGVTTEKPDHDIQMAIEEGYSYQWTSYASYNDKPPSLKELQSKAGAANRYTYGHYYHIGMSSFIHNTKECAPSLVYRFMHCRDDPEWEKNVHRIPRFDINMFMHSVL